MGKHSFSPAYSERIIVGAKSKCVTFAIILNAWNRHLPDGMHRTLMPEHGLLTKPSCVRWTRRFGNQAFHSTENRWTTFMPAKNLVK